MRKISVFAVAILVAAAFFVPGKAHAQKYKLQSVATASAGYSIAGILFGAIKEGLNATGEIKSTKTPVIITGYDFGVSDRFSVGAIYTYQGLTAKYNTYEYDSANNVITVSGDFTDRLSRQSVGLRPLFHFGDNDDLDIYAGMRFSYVFWNYSSNARTDVNIDELFDLLSAKRPRVQALFGMRYYFTPFIGVNAELAVGPTYFASFGVSTRFGGLK